jgi:HlyD family secretion protein
VNESDFYPMKISNLPLNGRNCQRTVVVTMTCMALLLAACKSSPDTASTAVNVEATTAKIQPISEHVRTDAILYPLAQAAIAPRISAPVKKFLVQRGAHVKAGQLLAELENKDLAAASMDNRGGYDQAKAAYQTATKAQVPEDYQRAQLDVEQSKANLDVAQKIFDSRQVLFAQGALPGRDLDSAKASLVQAKAAYDIALHHFESAQSVSRAAALQSAKGQLDSAEGKYLGAEAQYSYSEIRSPIDGVVTERPLYPGETAAAGTPLITVMDTSALLAKLHLPQSQAQRLKVGAAAEVQVTGVDEPIPAKVTLISPALDPGSTTLEVWVRVENAKGELKPGTPARVAIVGATLKDALVVPSLSLITDNAGAKKVMLIQDGVAKAHVVEVGVEDGEMVQIVNGLKAGDQVVTTGAFALDDGSKVKVVSSSEMEKDAGEKPEAGGDH